MLIWHSIRYAKSKQWQIYEFHCIFSHGFDGRACVSKMICDASTSLSAESGIFYRMFQLIFRYAKYNYLLMELGKSHNKISDIYSPAHVGDNLDSSFDAEQCEQFAAECPLRLRHLTPYTDLWICSLFISMSLSIFDTNAKINKHLKSIHPRERFFHSLFPEVISFSRSKTSKHTFDVSN